MIVSSSEDCGEKQKRICIVFPQKELSIIYKVDTDDENEQMEIGSTVTDIQTIIDHISKNESIDYTFSTDRFIHSIAYKAKDVFSSGSLLFRFGDEWEIRMIVKMFSYPAVLEDLSQMKRTFASSQKQSE